MNKKLEFSEGAIAILIMAGVHLLLMKLKTWKYGRVSMSL